MGTFATIMDLDVSQHGITCGLLICKSRVGLLQNYVHIVDILYKYLDTLESRTGHILSRPVKEVERFDTALNSAGEVEYNSSIQMSSLARLQDCKTFRCHLPSFPANVCSEV